MPRCPSCDERVSTAETECPSCGEPLKSQKSRGTDSKPKKKKKKSSGRSSGGSIIVIIAVVAVGVLFVCGGGAIALLLPAVQQAREAARRSQCKNNLKQIGLAMMNYHDTVQVFPAAYLNDSQGKPTLSWRVSILPYLDMGPLYSAYKFAEPWDGAANSNLHRSMPQTYYCASSGPPGTGITCYAAITGANTLLGAGTCVPIKEATDGLSFTIMVVEACQLGIPWMKPQDIDADSITRIGDPNGISSKHIGGVNVQMGDGSVRFITTKTDPAIIKALSTRNGNEQIPDF